MNNPSSDRAGGSSSSPLESAVQRGKERAEQISGRIGEISSEARGRLERMQENLRGAREGGKEAVSKMKHGKDVLQERFQRGASDFPLIMGLGFFALGFVFGVAVPRSEPEDRALGAYSDELKRQGKMAGEKVISQSERAAKRMMEAAQKETESEVEAGMNA